MKKIGRPKPKWIVDLEPGEYTLKDLENISGTTKSNVCNVLKLMGVKKKFNPNPVRNMLEVVYIWEGSSISQSYP